MRQFQILPHLLSDAIMDAHTPGERGKTKPLGAALALKAAGTTFIVAPKLVASDRMIGPI